MQHTTTEKTLSNGLTVLYIDLPGSTNFDLAVAINAGYRFSTKDNIDKYEIPHLLEHMIFEGSKNYTTSDDLQAVFTQGGGDANGFTTPYHNIFVFHNRNRHAESILRASLDMVFHPLLKRKIFDEEMKVVENELMEKMGDFAGNAMLYTMQQILPDYPVSNDTVIARLANVTYEDIKPYYKKYYSTANTTLVISADFSALNQSVLEKTILEVTADAPRGEKWNFPEFEIAKPSQITAGIRINRSIKESVAYAMFSRKDLVPIKTMVTLGLFCAIANSMKSYSVQYKLRKKGLVYGIDFSASQSTESHGLELCITADNQKFSEVYANILAGIRDLAETGIDKAEFESVRADFSETFLDGAASHDSIIEWYLGDYLMDGSLLSPTDYRTMANSITQEEMLRTVRGIFDYDNLYQTVFSAKPIRTSSAMELLAKEVIANKKPITPELLSENSLPLGDEDTKYSRTMFVLLLTTLVAFLAPLFTGTWKDSISNAYFSGIGMPLNLLIPVFYLIPFVSLLFMHGRDLRKNVFQMLFVFIAWLLIIWVAEPQSVNDVITNSDQVIRTQAWILLGSFTALCTAATFGARKVIAEWFTKRKSKQKSTSNKSNVKK